MVMRPTTRIAKRARHLADESSGHPLDQLHSLASLGADVSSEVDRLIIKARHEGAEWSAIGAALGVTKQGAQRRHDAAVRREQQ